MTDSDALTLRWGVFVVLIALTLAANLKFKLDLDRGGYAPALADQAIYPKAYVHAMTGFAIGMFAGVMGLPWLGALCVITIAAVFWERTQGFFNWLDVVAGVLGAACAYGVIAIFR